MRLMKRIYPRVNLFSLSQSGRPEQGFEHAYQGYRFSADTTLRTGALSKRERASFAQAGIPAKGDTGREAPFRTAVGKFRLMSRLSLHTPSTNILPTTPNNKKANSRKASCDDCSD